MNSPMSVVINEFWSQINMKQRTANNDTLFDFWTFLKIWSDATFGNPQDRGPQGPADHLKKEADELYKETIKGNGDGLRQRPEVMIEAVDCFHLILDTVRREGFTFNQFVEACFNKLATNCAREWQPFNPTVAIEHIRE